MAAGDPAETPAAATAAAAAAAAALRRYSSAGRVGGELDQSETHNKTQAGKMILCRYLFVE